MTYRRTPFVGMNFGTNAGNNDERSFHEAGRPMAHSSRSLFDTWIRNPNRSTEERNQGRTGNPTRSTAERSQGGTGNPTRFSTARTSFIRRKFINCWKHIKEGFKSVAESTGDNAECNAYEMLDHTFVNARSTSVKDASESGYWNPSEQGTYRKRNTASRMKSDLKDYTPLCDSKYDDTALWIGEKTYNSISEIIRSLQTIPDAEQRLILFEKLNSFGLDIVLKVILKYLSIENTLPTVICNWLETTEMQDKFKKLILTERVNINKSKLLIKCLKLKDNAICRMWTTFYLEAVSSSADLFSAILLREILVVYLKDQSFINNHFDLILKTMESLIFQYLLKANIMKPVDHLELRITWSLILRNLLSMDANKLIKRCSSVVTSYVAIKINNIELVERTVNQFINEFSLCSEKNDLHIRFSYELLKSANSINHSKAIKCCELASFVNGSLFYTGNNGNHLDTSGECFDTVYTLYSHMYVFTKQFVNFQIDSEQPPNHLDHVHEEMISIMADTICRVNVIADLLKYFPNRKYCCKIKTSIFDDTKTSVAVLLQSQPKNVASDIIHKIIHKTINDGPYWSKSLEIALDIFSLPNEELITLYKSAMSKYSDSPNFILIVQNFVSLCGMSNLEYNNLSLTDTQCVWNVHFRKTTNNKRASQIRKILDSDEKLLTSDEECLMEEKKMIETIRNLEFLNLVFIQTEDQSIILKYNKLIFRRLESLLLALTNVVEFDHNSYLPVGVITAMVSFLFEKLMKFYHEDLHKYVPQSTEICTLDTKILCDYFTKIWITLSNECKSCIHELVLESLTNCIKYLELDEKVQKDLFCICFDLVKSNCYQVEISAYTILARLCELHIDKFETDTELDRVPFQIKDLALKHFEPLVSIILENTNVGHVFIPIHFTINFKSIRVYLLLWNLIIKLCLKLKENKGSKFISYINHDDSFPRLMENLLKLMPRSVKRPNTNKDKIQINKQYFCLPPECKPKSYWDKKRLRHLVCWTYYSIMHTLPSVSRKWRLGRHNDLVPLLNNITSVYVSPCLIAQEFQDIKEAAKKMDNIVVNLHEHSRILIVSFITQETSLDLTIKIDVLHPFIFSLNINGMRDTSKQLKKCMKELNDLFIYQNCSLVDGVKIWHLKMTNIFDDVKDCNICFSKTRSLPRGITKSQKKHLKDGKFDNLPVPYAFVAHPSKPPHVPSNARIEQNFNDEIPEFKCPMCHNKFHNKCLGQWFNITPTPNCPFCRYSFIF